MTETGYTVILGQLFKCVATDGKMELIEEKIGGQLSCKTCGLKVSKILLEGRKWWRCGKCGTRNYTMPRNPESLKKCPVCGGDYGHVQLNKDLREARLEREKKKVR